MDYFAPILKRILSLTSEIQTLTQASQDVVKQSDLMDADVEDFMSSLEDSHKAALAVYEKGIKLSVSKSRLSVELDILRHMPKVAEKAGDLGSMSLMMADIISQNYLEVAIGLGHLDSDLYGLVFKELSTYDNWAEKKAALLDAIGKV